MGNVRHRPPRIRAHPAELDRVRTGPVDDAGVGFAGAYRTRFLGG
ncbi:hypothetical protein [Streptomyces pimonensis]